MRFKFLLSTRKHPPRLAEEVAEVCGFNGVEPVLPWDMSVAHAREYRLLKTAKAIHAPIAPDKFGPREFVDSLNRAIEMALIVGARLVNIHPGGTVANRKDVLACVSELQRLEGVKFPGGKVAYEVPQKSGLNQSRHERQRAYAHPQDWVKDVYKYNLAATIDTTHLASWGEDPAAYVKQLKPHLAHVHVSDYLPATKDSTVGKQHLFIGEGKIDFANFFHRLRKLRVDELLVTLEPKGRYDIETKETQEKLRTSLQRLKECAGVTALAG